MNICVCCETYEARIGLNYCPACGACSDHMPCWGDEDEQITAMLEHGLSEEDARLAIERAKAGGNH